MDSSTEMENPLYKMEQIQSENENWPKNQMYYGILDNSMDLTGKNLMGMNNLEMNSVPINVRNILKKIYSNGFKRNDEFDLDKLIIKIYDLQDHEKSLEKKKIYYEIICLVDSFNDLITKDRGCISIESIQKMILIIKAFSKLTFFPKNFDVLWIGQGNLSTYFNFPESLLHIMQVMNYEFTREEIHNNIIDIHYLYYPKDILILSKINTYEYLEMSVKNAINNYKIIDSKFIEKKNKIEEVLNKMKSSFFLNEKKNNKF
jgi:hypothetical protein